MKNAIVFIIMFFVFILSAEAQDSIVISDAWVREVPPGTSVSAVYMTIKNVGKDDDILMVLSSDIAQSAELHTSKVNEQGVATMERIKELKLSSGETVEFKPGGMHIMLIGLKDSLVGKDSINLDLEFDENGEISVRVPVKRTGETSHENVH